MTNLQLILSIGIPSLLILISWLTNNARLSDLAKRIDSLERSLGERIDRLDHRIDGLERRLERLEIRFDRVEDEIRKDHESRLTRLESRVFAA
jgi:chromosome segregation ATPase